MFNFKNPIIGWLPLLGKRDCKKTTDSSSLLSLIINNTHTLNLGKVDMRDIRDLERMSRQKIENNSKE